MCLYLSLKTIIYRGMCRICTIFIWKWPLLCSERARLNWKCPLPHIHIYHMSSRASFPEYQPLCDTKTLARYVTGIGWHNAPGHLCHLGADILVCHPRRHVILIMYTVASTQIVFGDNLCRYTCTCGAYCRPSWYIVIGYNMCRYRPSFSKSKGQQYRQNMLATFIMKQVVPKMLIMLSHSTLLYSESSHVIFTVIKH